MGLRSRFSFFLNVTFAEIQTELYSFVSGKLLISAADAVPGDCMRADGDCSAHFGDVCAHNLN
jgi:hypothetical protein